jgi:protoheme IX farnesyltransferase
MATDLLATPTASPVASRALALSTPWSDYWAMTKPEVNVLIAVTTATSFAMASSAGHDFSWMALANALFGTVLVASGAATLNQWMERAFDAKMRRTARRPIAAGRIPPQSALEWGVLQSVVGVASLAVTAGWLASLLALATLLAYLIIYTPLKRRTPLCTLLGAAPGAAPALIGWAAARGRLDGEAWLLFAIVFLWQLPHFMAIAWMYRDDYDHAGYRVLPRGRARGTVVALQTLVPLSALVPLSLLPALAAPQGMLYGLVALALGVGFLYCGAEFVSERSGPAAGRLLRASILYLPSLLALMILRVA